MTRALLWKELREQRQLVLAAWLIVAVLPLFLIAGMFATTPDYELAALGEMLPTVVMLFVWPVFGAATGATSVGADMADGSLRFLFSRPVSRTRVWRAKVVAAAAALSLVIVGSTLIAALFDLLLTGRGRAFGSLAGGEAGGFLIAAFALFIGAHYCSLFFKRPLAAALAGFVVMALMAMSVGAVWSLFVRSRAQGPLTFLATPLTMLGLLIAAWWVFTRTDLFGEHAARRMAKPLVIVTLCAALMGALPGGYSAARRMVMATAGAPIGMRLLDGATALVQPSATGLGTRLLYLDARTATARTLGARNAAAPTLSPDGSLLAYVHYPSFFLPSLSSAVGEVRVVRSDGSNDRVVIPEATVSLGRDPLLSISPDNRFVMLYSSRQGIMLAEAASADPDTRFVRFSRPTPERWTFRILGWTAGSGPELLYVRRLERYRVTGSAPRFEVVAVDPTSTNQRVVATFAGQFSSVLQANGARTTINRAWSWHPLRISQDDPADARLLLLETSSGESIELSEAPCRAWGFSADSSEFFYSHCSGSRYTTNMELRVRNLETGVDEAVGVIEGVHPQGSGHELLPSPDGSRLAAFIQRGRRRPATFVIERGGSAPGAPGNASPTVGAREAPLELLATDYYPIGWIDDDHVVVVSQSARRGPHLEVAVINVETGAVRQVYSQ